MSSDSTAIPESVRLKLQVLVAKLHVSDPDAALEKSLDIANYVADVISDPERKLLVEQSGKFIELTGLLQ